MNQTSQPVGHSIYRNEEMNSTSAHRLLVLRDRRALRVHRVTLRAHEVTQSNLFWEFFPLHKYRKQKSTKYFTYECEKIIF